MSEEVKSLIKKIQTLDSYIENHENIFLELSLKKKKIPEDFLNNYLELISEVNKNSSMLERMYDEKKNLLGATK